MNEHLQNRLSGFDVQDTPRLRELVHWLATDPPSDPGDVALAFRPLFQRKPYDVAVVFPALLEGLGHTSVAAAILDLANHLTREGRVSRHPAAERSAELVGLLGGLAQRLGRLEEQPLDPESASHEASTSEPHSGEKQFQQTAVKVSESVSLAVALCDALALIGDQSAVGKLYQTLELKHRRLRTEAAAALARLGEETGRKALVELAAEPVARLRVLAYAEELGLLDQVDPQHSSPTARAEAELAVWLAEPTQFGWPPTRCELVDARTQYWPGFNEPVACYLFRFIYELGNNQYSNVGIAGPLSQSLLADLSELSPDDIYAAFAGWQAEHEEIRETPADRLTSHLQVEATRLERRLRDAGYESIIAITLGSFFGDKVLIANAAREGLAGIAVADALEIWWRPGGNGRRPIGPAEAYCIYKGRRLLRTFNTPLE